MGRKRRPSDIQLYISGYWDFFLHLFIFWEILYDKKKAEIYIIGYKACLEKAVCIIKLRERVRERVRERELPHASAAYTMNAVSPMLKSNISRALVSLQHCRFTITFNSFCHSYFTVWIFCDTGASFSIYIYFFSPLYFRIYILILFLFRLIWRYGEFFFFPKAFRMQALRLLWALGASVWRWMASSDFVMKNETEKWTEIYIYVFKVEGKDPWRAKNASVREERRRGDVPQNKKSEIKILIFFLILLSPPPPFLDGKRSVWRGLYSEEMGYI